MIEVQNLKKRFGGVVALRDVSFDVPEGEILGFLGPNGAGKSTTMRILTGFLPGDSGTVRVAGHDVSRASRAVRQNIGYLPEGVPVYPEMRVLEYLRHRARLKGIARPGRRAAIDRVLELTHTSERRRQIIGTLSRGYRQRVGLADALLGEPRVLILDEPTVGLDPEQVRQFRSLIRDVGRDRTVVLSTHILSEVELICSSVVILAGGSVVARDRAADLRRRFGPVRRVLCEIAAGSQQGNVAAALGALPGVSGVTAAGDSTSSDERGYHEYSLEVAGDEDLRPLVFELVRERNWKLRELKSEEMSLEDAFVSLVGAALPASPQRAKEGAAS